MAQQTPYIGSKISLISKLDIRYEGILYTVDSKESTIALSKVRSFGTEDRSSAHVVPPQEDVYDYIIFKANDIKDLIVCEMPKPAAPGLPYDPAILSVSEKPAESPMSTPQASNDQKAPRLSTPVSSRNGERVHERHNRPQNGTRGNYNNRGYNNNRGQTNQYRNNYRNDYRDNNRDGPRHYNNSRGNNYNNRSRGQRTNNRGGNQRQTLKFDNDYDFEKANKQFEETMNSIVKAVEASKIDADDVGSDSGKSPSPVAYDKNVSFFDNISCEALEKQQDKNTRPDWRKERMINQETFGQQSVRSYGYHRRGNNRGNYRNRNNYQR